MEKSFPDLKEMELRLDEDYNAALNMIGEGAPEYSPFNEEDDAPAEMKSSETKAKDLH